LFENKAFFNNFLPIDRSLIANGFRDFDVNNLEIILTFYQKLSDECVSAK